MFALCAVLPPPFPPSTNTHTNPTARAEQLQKRLEGGGQERFILLLLGKCTQAPLLVFKETNGH